MKIQIDENGYVQNFVIVGESSACDIEVEEPENFDMMRWNAYRLIDGVLKLDNEKLDNMKLEEQKNEIRHRREKECFSVINRGQLWYETIGLSQLIELRKWYKAWRDATDTMVIPECPSWLEQVIE